MAGASSRTVLRHLNTLFHCGAAGQLGDAELLERFVAGRDEGSEAAFAALVERHGVMVLGVCRRVLGSRDEAEDAFQATFLVLARKASAIARREQLASWLHGVARRAALDARARATRQKAREKRLGAMRHVEPPDQTLMSELRAVLDEELAQLPERHRAAILLCELEGLSRRDAAIRLGISEGTLSSRLSRAKLRLRDRLTRRGFALSSAALATVLVQDAQAMVLPPLLLDSTIRVAILVAAGSSLAGVVSTSVATLSEGVMKAMLLAKLKFAFLGLFTLAVVSTGVGVVAQSPPQATPDRLADNDRLKSVEQKLDKLLEVLGGSGHSPHSADPTNTAPAPSGAPPSTSLAPVPPPPLAAGMPHNMMGMMPGMAGMRGMGAMGGSMSGQHDLGARVNRLEQRVGELERRIGALEHRITSATPKVGDARRGFTGSAGYGVSSSSRTSASGPRTPADSNGDADPFSDTRPAADKPAQTNTSTPSSDSLTRVNDPAPGEGDTVSASSAADKPK
jgi:RNA polymerase sigma factor (sigma-70 family)